jgi:hypothetical protein
MAIEDTFERAQRGLLAFLGDPGQNLLSLRAEPDLAQLSARLVAALGKDRRADAVIFGAEAPFDDAPGFFDAVRRAVVENLEANAARAAEIGLALPDVADLEARARAGGAPVEVCFAAFVEQVARALSARARSVVVVMAVTSAAADDGAIAASFGLLSRATAAPQVKYVLLEPRRGPRLAPGRAARDRYAALASPADLGAAIEALLSSPTRRVLAVRAAAAIDEALLAAGARRGAPPFTVASVRAPFSDPWAFVAAAEEALLAIGAPLAPVAPLTQVGLAARLADLAEQVAHRRVRDRALLVRLAPRAVGDARAFRAFARSLATAAASPRVKYLLVDPTATGALPDEPFAPLHLAAMEIHLPPEAIEASIVDALKGGGLDPRARVRYLTLACGFAASRGVHEEARVLARRAVEESAALDDPGEASLAWTSLGHARYRAEAYDEAREAYARAASIALGAGRHPLVAQNLIHVGNAHFSAEEYEPAARCYHAGADYHARMSNAFGECLALTWLGEAERRRERWGEAAQAFQQALARYDAVGDPLGESAAEGKIEVLERLALVYDEAGRGREAGELRARAEALGGKGRIVDRP